MPTTLGTPHAGPLHVDRLAEQLLCAGLIGSDAKFPTPAPSALVESIATLARLHGVEPLLHRCAVKAKSLLLWPQALLEQFAQTTRAQAVTEVLWQREIRQLLDALDSAGVPALLLKGAPLAYTHYEAPYLRPRGDTDVLIPVDQRAAAHGVLLDCGYTAAISPASSFASYQLTYTKRCASAPITTIDLHWRLSNRQLFAQLFTFTELWRASVPIPAIAPTARGLSSIHALILACVHRASHVTSPLLVDGRYYYEPNRLIWLYDIRLLCSSFDADHQSDHGVTPGSHAPAWEPGRTLRVPGPCSDDGPSYDQAPNCDHQAWTALVDIASRKAIRRICLDALAAARDRVGADIPAGLMQQLADGREQEASANYLRPSHWLHQHLTDLNAMPTFRQKIGLVLDIAFPPINHMLNKYDTDKRWLLPLLYLRRGLMALLRGGPRRRP